MATGARSPSGAKARSRRVDAFDGLRALAVLAVLAYHQGFRWARGGYLGVSSFFTLSGFLITTLLWVERRKSGHNRLGSFWARRARRLLPAALLTLAGIVVAQLLTKHWQGPRLRGDLWASLGYVANWRFATAPTGYAALFTSPSPVQHFWSLAVEEQFYLFFPLLVLAVCWIGRRGASRHHTSPGRLAVPARRERRLLRGESNALLGVIGALTLASFAVAWHSAATGTNDGFGYYATTHRAGELLLGAFAALVWARRRQLRPGVRRAIVAGGWVGVAALVALWSTVTLSDRWLFRGGVEVNAVATVAVILAGMAPVGLAKLLAWRPLVGLGRISYGVYLFHWPLFAFVTADAVGAGGWRLFAVRFGVVVGVATVSFVFLEEPIRTGHRPQIAGRGIPVRWARSQAPARSSVMAASGAAAFLLLVGAVFALPRAGSASRVVLTQRHVQTGNLGPVASSPPPAGPGAAAPAIKPLRVLVIGDSVAYTFANGAQAWTRAHASTPLALEYHIEMGCPITGQSIVRLGGRVLHTFPDCNRFVSDTAAQMAFEKPDVVFVLAGLADLADHKLVSGPLADGRWHHLGEPAFDQWELVRLTNAADRWQASGVPVVWASFPAVNLAPLPGGDGTVHENDTARQQRFNQLLLQAAAGHPALTFVDLAQFMNSLPGGALSSRWRSDGVHFTVDGSTEAADFVVPALFRAAGRPAPAP